MSDHSKLWNDPVSMNPRNEFGCFYFQVNMPIFRGQWRDSSWDPPHRRHSTVLNDVPEIAEAKTLRKLVGALEPVRILVAELWIMCRRWCPWLVHHGSQPFEGHEVNQSSHVDLWSRCQWPCGFTSSLVMSVVCCAGCVFPRHSPLPSFRPATFYTIHSDELTEASCSFIITIHN